MDRSRLRTAVAGALTVAMHVARADDPPTLEKVEVVGRHDDAVGIWDSASQGAVSRETIENRPLQRPGDVLETIPGMAVTRHSGDGKANQYNPVMKGPPVKKTWGKNSAGVVPFLLWSALLRSRRTHHSRRAARLVRAT